MNYRRLTVENDDTRTTISIAKLITSVFCCSLSVAMLAIHHQVGSSLLWFILSAIVKYLFLLIKTLNGLKSTIAMMNHSNDNGWKWSPETLRGLMTLLVADHSQSVIPARCELRLRGAPALGLFIRFGTSLVDSLTDHDVMALPQFLPMKGHAASKQLKAITTWFRDLQWIMNSDKQQW